MGREQEREHETWLPGLARLLIFWLSLGMWFVYSEPHVSLL